MFDDQSTQGHSRLCVCYRRVAMNRVRIVANFSVDIIITPKKKTQRFLLSIYHIIQQDAVVTQWL